MFPYSDLELEMMSRNFFYLIITIGLAIAMQSFKDISFVVSKKQGVGGFLLSLMENMNFSSYGE